MSPRWGLVLRNLRPPSLVVYNARRRTRQAPREGMRGTSCFAKALRPSFVPGHTCTVTSVYTHCLFSLPTKEFVSFLCRSQLSFYLLQLGPLQMISCTLSKGRWTFVCLSQGPLFWLNGNMHSYLANDTRDASLRFSEVICRFGLSSKAIGTKETNAIGRPFSGSLDQVHGHVGTEKIAREIYLARP